MIFEIRSDPAKFCQIHYPISDNEEELQNLNSALWGNDPIADWCCLPMKYSDPSLRVPDFIGLPMVGIIAAKKHLLESAPGLGDAVLLDAKVGEEEYWIIRPPVRTDCLDTEASHIEYSDSDIPRLRKAVFFGSVDPEPWLFRAPHSVYLYTTDGANSFVEWYRKERLTGLKFTAQETTSASGTIETKTPAAGKSPSPKVIFNLGIDTTPAPKGRPNKKTLDLTSTGKVVKDHLMRAFSCFHEKVRDEVVCAIEIRFDVDLGGYFINIDTRDEYFAGTWDEMEYCDFASKIFEEWGDFRESMAKTRRSLITYTGEKLSFGPLEDGYIVIGKCSERYHSENPDGGHLVMALGEMITEVMKELSAERFFRGWKLKPGSRFYVNETTHQYCTPFEKDLPEFRLSK